MSDNDRNIHDPIIDTVEESDGENAETVPSTPASEQVDQTDPAQDIGAYNGDSLVVTGSPFKKSYSGSSLGEASVDSLVDEPLPIESVALSPFRMDSIHNSPLPTRQKDPHTFSVSVSDSLPPHVMELDSPEHYGERVDDSEDNEFCVDKDPPVKISQGVEEFLIGTKVSSSESVAEAGPLPEIYHTEAGSLDQMLTASHDIQKRKGVDWEEEQSSPSKKGQTFSPAPSTFSQMDTQPIEDCQSINSPHSSHFDQTKVTSWTITAENYSCGAVALSQQDMFESQTGEDREKSPPVFPASETSEVSRHFKVQEEAPQKSKSFCNMEEEEEELMLEEDIIPSSDIHRYSKDPIHPFGEEFLKKSSPSLPSAASPAKRKRESLDESKEGMDSKVLKKDREGEEEEEEKALEDTYSDIEILEESHSVNRSIEVVYDRKKPYDTEPAESQDLNLILTEDSQADYLKSKNCSGERSEEEKDSGQSQSLLSMPESDRLTCRDSFSSMEGHTPVESTIRATQMELLCKPGSPLSQPNIESLVNLPIKENSSTSNKSNQSTNNHNGSSNKIEVDENTRSVTSPIPHLDTQESVEESPREEEEKDTQSQSQGKDTSVSYPHFDTPSQVTQDTENETESLFVKASKAADKKRKEERELEQQYQAKEVVECSDNKARKDSFDASPVIVEVSKRKSQRSDGEGDTDSNHSTPLCAINPSRSSQSTPISSQIVMETSTHRLFPKISQEHNSSSDRELSQKSQIYAEDSDEDVSAKSQHKNGKLLPFALGSQSKQEIGKKTSTPNDSSNSMSPNLSKEGGSYIKKESHANSTLNSSQSRSLNNKTALDSTKGDTQEMEIESDAIHSVKDMIEEGWTKMGIRKITFPPVECWMSPTTKEIVFSIIGENDIIKESTPIGRVISFTSTSRSSSSSEERRISDISSISRTTSSSGYAADKSSSSVELVRMESTRLSTMSVSVISPPHSIHYNKLSDSETSSKTDSDLPPPKTSHVPKLTRVTVETQTDFPPDPFFNVNTSTTDDSYEEVKPKRSRGRGRPRGRGKGRGRAIERRPLNVPTSIKEDESKEDVDAPLLEGSESTSPTEEKKDDDFYSLLPDFLREKLKTAQIPLTEDEEEIFILQKNQTDPDAQKRQYEEVLSKVRIAEIERNTLVFARYLDKNYYSAIVSKWVKDDKWEVQYNLDGCVNCVRELYILPTEILPKGISCHVRHPNQKFSDPGLVKGHIYQNDTLIHLIEVHKGIVVKATHSHIILSPEVANDLLESRLAFHSMIASPGGDVSLDNIVAGKRRSETTSSPQKRLQSALSTPPRKPDANLDTSGTNMDKKGGESKQKSTKTKDSVSRGQKVPTTYSESSNELEASAATSSNTTPKSTRKKLFKPSPSHKTPRTPRSGKSTRTPRGKKQQQQPDSPTTKSSKKTVSSNEPRTSEGEIIKESLMNPFVELIQLDEVSVSPKSIPKKRGRRPGSGTKNPKKLMKVEAKSPSKEDSLQEIDPRLGPLPLPGCQIFKGYSILITHAGNVLQQHPQENEEGITEECIPLDREHLREQISGAEGHVIDSFDEAYLLHIQTLQSKKSSSSSGRLHSLKVLPSSQSPSKVLCISNSFCRTAKFIQCLTVGIPLVSSAWVIYSLERNTCSNWLHFLLPAGMSLLTGNLMEQTFSDNLKDASSSVGRVVEVLKGEKVFLATSSNPAFGDLWLHLLNAADAVVFKMPPKGGNIQRLIDRRTSVVIADASIPDEELKRAKEANVPIVSSEWFIQSLIARCKLPYDAHPDFNYAHKLNKNTPIGADEEKEEREGER